VNAANAGALAATLEREREVAFLFRTLATLRTDIPLFDSIDDLKWSGPKPEFEALGTKLDAAVTEPQKKEFRKQNSGARKQNSGAGIQNSE
jgi:5'-3' exonuclease